MFNFETLRKKYPDFIYHGFEIIESDSKVSVKYHFEVKNLENFYPEWTFNKGNNFENLDKSLLDNLVFSLGMVELISYWKCVCSPNVYVLPYGLNEDMISWWKELYFNGLGEFFYLNGITTDKDSFMNIIASGKLFEKNEKVYNLVGSLVPVGGGKDSAVTIKILKKIKENVSPYIINPRGASLATCEVAGFDSENTVSVKRTIDKNLIKLNSLGYLNGHTPFSAIVAFSSIISALFNSKKYVVLSNESSANESTVLGESINHQFSKGEDFEKAFIDYEKKYINSGVEYFSFLRPLSEMQIAMLFAKYKEFHNVFKSCNAGSKKDIWCCNCPKCLFVYIILSPFLSEEELISIFGENLLDKEELLETYKQLSGVLPNKPFECVGSRDEVVVASEFTLRTLKEQGKEIPYLLKFFESISIDSDKDLNYYKDFFDTKHHLPLFFENALRDELKECR